MISCLVSLLSDFWRLSVKQEFHLEEDDYYTEDEYVEEEEDDDDEDSSVEKKKKGRGRGSGEPRMKMRRIFRITHGRERQRGETSLMSGVRQLHTQTSLFFSSSSSSLSLQSKTRMAF